MGWIYEAVDLGGDKGFVGKRDDLDNGHSVVGHSDRQYPLTVMKDVAFLLTQHAPGPGKVRVTMSSDMVGFLKANVDAAIDNGNLEEGGISEDEANALQSELSSTWAGVGASDDDARYEASYSDRGGYWYVDFRDEDSGSTVFGANGEHDLTEEMAEDIATALDNMLPPSGFAHVDMTVDQAQFARTQVRAAGNLRNYEFEGGEIDEESVMDLEDRLGRAIEGETHEELKNQLENEGALPRM